MQKEFGQTASNLKATYFVENLSSIYVLDLGFIGEEVGSCYAYHKRLDTGYDMRSGLETETKISKKRDTPQ